MTKVVGDVKLSTGEAGALLQMTKETCYLRLSGCQTLTNHHLIVSPGRSGSH